MSDCAICERPVEAGTDLMREIRGYEKPGRGAGGQSGSSLVLREPTGRVAHVACVLRIQGGLDPSQEAMF